MLATLQPAPFVQPATRLVDEANLPPEKGTVFLWDDLLSSLPRGERRERGQVSVSPPWYDGLPMLPVLDYPYSTCINPHIGYKRRVKLRSILRSIDPRCSYCGRIVSKHSASLDHVRPRSRGGKNRITNIILVCASCNSLKSNLSLNNFLELVATMHANVQRLVDERTEGRAA